mmetsp:Transcript_74277/g.128830  ORF Transcript_74277/g.128830 Transcript_74277/m.128830 type:complete len:201 (+) Transcript_74277:551-1153(+)
MSSSSMPKTSVMMRFAVWNRLSSGRRGKQGRPFGSSSPLSSPSLCCVFFFLNNFINLLLFLSFDPASSSVVPVDCIPLSCSILVLAITLPEPLSTNQSATISTMRKTALFAPCINTHSPELSSANRSRKDFVPVRPNFETSTPNARSCFFNVSSVSPPSSACTKLDVNSEPCVPSFTCWSKQASSGTQRNTDRGAPCATK